jgi:hypothetical protein
VNFERIDVFPSYVYKTNIDPGSYNKKELLDTVVENYKREPNRNTWDYEQADKSKVSTLHHYYNDWDNPKFIKPDLEKLSGIYKNLCKDFIRYNVKTKKGVICDSQFVNITVCDNTQFMSEHNHVNEDVKKPWCLFAMVHFIQIQKYQKSTVFISPPYSSIPHVKYDKYKPTIDHAKTVLTTDLTNTSFFDEICFNIKEDDVLFFPSYLMHRVDTNDYPSSVDELRVVGACNIDIKFGDQ